MSEGMTTGPYKISVYENRSKRWLKYRATVEFYTGQILKEFKGMSEGKVGERAASWIWSRNPKMLQDREILIHSEWVK